jgi:hypothetical protein
MHVVGGAHVRLTCRSEVRPQITSLAGNVVIAQLVDQTVGVHVKMPRAIFH